MADDEGSTRTLDDEARAKMADAARRQQAATPPEVRSARAKAAAAARERYRQKRRDLEEERFASLMARADAKGRRKQHGAKEREERFARAWIETLGDPLESAVRAGVRATVPSTLRSAVSRLLKRDSVQRRIRELRKQAEMDAFEVVHHIAEIGRGNLAAYYDDRGEFDWAGARRDGKLHLIQRVRTVTRPDGSTCQEIWGHSRLEALAMLQRFHGLGLDRGNPFKRLPKDERELDSRLLEEYRRVTGRALPPGPVVETTARRIEEPDPAPVTAQTDEDPVSD